VIPRRAACSSALPEVANAGRRADMTDPDRWDPCGSSRSTACCSVADTPSSASRVDRTPALVALVGATGVDQQQLAARLAPDLEAQRIMSVVEDARVFHRCARRERGSTRSSAAVGDAPADPVHARDAYLLAQALGELTPAQWERLDLLYRFVSEALGHPEIVSSSATNLAGARLAAAQRLLDDEAPMERLRHTATTHLLSHEPEVLARQARLIEPLPRPGVVRVAVSPSADADHWAIDVACRDTDGLLARLTDVLADMQLQIVRADIATWPDGGVVDSFVVRSYERPNARALGTAFEEGLTRPLAAVDPVDVQFAVQQTLPWYTVCTCPAPMPLVLRAVGSFAAAERDSARCRPSTVR
jgi:hypothetical protein